jgi:hypothetical protein
MCFAWRRNDVVDLFLGSVANARCAASSASPSRFARRRLAPLFDFAVALRYVDSNNNNARRNNAPSASRRVSAKRYTLSDDRRKNTHTHTHTHTGMVVTNTHAHGDRTARSILWARAPRRRFGSGLFGRGCVLVVYSSQAFARRL